MTAAGKTVVFLGPTMHRTACPPLPDCTFRPPAAMGCITRAVAEGCSAVVLVDGVFENGPSVWHKEILWGLSRGIPVIGCSSMGALRAAELHGCGMFGHGKVFESYLNGTVEDDDEVAVVHGPAETGWLPLTDAMIDIRDYAALALSEGWLDNEEAIRLTEHAKNKHFKLRSFKDSFTAVTAFKDDGILSLGTQQWLAKLPCGAKERDCRSLLANLTTILLVARERLAQTLPFQPTVYLSRLERFGFNF